MASRPLRIGLVAGESSGDVLGADLIRAYKSLHPTAEFAGIGGPLMQSAGMDCWVPAEQLAVMGFAEVIAHLPRLLRIRSSLRRRMLDWQPDVFIGIDAPDFNLPVERWLKERGIRTVHYVSPSIWAWRQGRAAKIGRAADCVLCLFPMEPAIYQKHHVNATFVGHPLADDMPIEPLQMQARTALGLNADDRVLALLPGSRLSEINMLAPIFLSAAAELIADVPDLRIVVPLATPAVGRRFNEILSEHPRYQSLQNRVITIDRRAQQVMTAADAILLASGTAALEAMMAKQPMVVAHRIARSTYALVKGLGMLRTDVYSLPNFLAGRTIVPELMQDECTPDRIAAALRDAFVHREQFDREILPTFVRIHTELRQDASTQAAAAIDALLRAP